jgi:hypothetical protein
MTTFDYRFVLTTDSLSPFGATMIGEMINVSKMSDEEMRKCGVDFAKSNKEWFDAASKTHMIMVDYGQSKINGGLGASYPIESVILTKPE